MDVSAAIQQAQAMQQAAAGVAGQQAKPVADDVAGQIEKLSQLRDSGSLSDEEFADAKRKLLEDLERAPRPTPARGEPCRLGEAPCTRRRPFCG